MKHYFYNLFCLLTLFFVCSCQIPITRHTETFNQNVAFLPSVKELHPNVLHSSDGQYLKTKAHVCEYGTAYNEENDTANIMSIYKKFFSDYGILGTSGFTGHYEDPAYSASFAYNIGADILLTAHSLISKSGRVANKVSVIANDYWTGAVMSSNYYEDYKYKQEGLFLRKKDDNTENIWLQTEKTFPRDIKQDSLAGMYENSFYSLNLYSSDQYIVAVVNKKSRGKVSHRGNLFEIKEDSFFPKYDFYKGEVKFYFDKKTMKGIYLRSDRCPVEAVFNFSKERNNLTVKRAFDSEQSYLTFKKID